MTTKITFNDLDQDLKDKLDATGSEVVSPGNVAKFGDTSGIATLRVPDDVGQRLLLIKDATNPGDYAAHQIIRNVNMATGTPGFVGFGLNCKTTINGSSPQSEWAGFFAIDNNSTASGTWPQHVAVYGQANKNSPSSTWASCYEISDMYGSGAAIGQEITARCNGADNQLTPQRIGTHISIMKGDSNPQDGEWGRGVWVTSGVGARFMYGFSAEGTCSQAIFHANSTSASASAALVRDTSSLPIGIDLSAATYSSNIALALKAGHAISWETTQQIKTNYDQTSGRWRILKGGTEVFWVNMNTGENSITTGSLQTKYISAKLASTQSISTGANNVAYSSVGRDTTEGLITIDSTGLVTVFPSVAEFEIVACTQVVGTADVTLRADLSNFASGINYPNPRCKSDGVNPPCSISTGIIFNAPSSFERTFRVILESSSSGSIENSGASAIMVRVVSTR